MKLRLRQDFVLLSSPDSSLSVLVGESDSFLLEDASPARLEDAGLLVPPTLAPPPVAAFWQSAGLQPDLPGPRPLHILDWSSTHNPHLLSALQAVGFEISSDGIILAVVDDYLDPRLTALSQRCRADDRPWLIAKCIGHTLWLGPVFAHSPNQPCHECLAFRLRPNRWRQCLLTGHGPGSAPPQFSTSALPTSPALAASAIAHLLGAWLRTSPEVPLAHSIFTFDTRQLSLVRHRVLPVPGCPHCKCNSPLPPPRNIEDFRAFVSPLTGIVPKVEIHTESAPSFHAKADVIQPLPLGPGRSLLRPNLAIGKGLTATEAEIGCIAEAIERHSLAWSGLATQHPASTPPLPLDTLLQISPRQYQNRSHHAQSKDPRLHIPQPWPESLPIDYTSVTSLLDQTPALVPTTYCYFGHPQNLYCRPDTNGCAAGPTLEQATLHALLELIERDAAAIWWYNRIRRPEVPLDALREPESKLIAKQFLRQGRTVHLLDLTTDLAIPVYAAITCNPNGARPIFGLGCSFDPEIAARRALAEMSQVSFWLQAHPQPDPLWAHWLSHTSCSTETYLAPLGAVNPIQSPLPSDPLQACIDRLRQAGLVPYTLNLTQPAIGLPVVRAIVPGLRHFWPRFGPGRLYDVPVQMGWLTAPTPEPDLNPIPCLL